MCVYSCLDIDRYILTTGIQSQTDTTLMFSSFHVHVHVSDKINLQQIKKDSSFKIGILNYVPYLRHSLFLF